MNALHESERGRTAINSRFVSVQIHFSAVQRCQSAMNRIIHPKSNRSENQTMRITFIMHFKMPVSLLLELIQSVSHYLCA